jgi:hypothetical protein
MHLLSILIPGWRVDLDPRAILPLDRSLNVEPPKLISVSDTRPRQLITLITTLRLNDSEIGHALIIGIAAGTLLSLDHL